MKVIVGEQSVQSPWGFPERDSPVCGAGKSFGSKGVVSADRSEAAALLGTTPRAGPLVVYKWGLVITCAVLVRTREGDRR